MSKRDKRGNGQGTLYQRSGRRGWFGAVTANGKRKIVHAETKTEAAHLLAQAITQREGAGSWSRPIRPQVPISSSGSSRW